jgi:hypothetical protein
MVLAIAGTAHGSDRTHIGPAARLSTHPPWGGPEPRLAAGGGVRWCQ